MIQLDLHGLSHQDAEKALDRTINRLWGSNEELHIITGHSKKMKQIVIDLLKVYKLEYTVGDFSGINTGFIRTLLE